jgi:Pilin (bacterial filament)
MTRLLPQCPLRAFICNPVRVLVGVFGVLAVNAAIAVCPAGDPVMVRQSAISESMLLSATARLAVSESYAVNGVFPNSNNEAGLPAPTAFQIDSDGDGLVDSPPCFMQSLTVVLAGRIVTIVNATPGYDQGVIEWTPTDTGGTVAWSCTTDMSDGPTACVYTGTSVGKALTWGVYAYDTLRNVSTVHCWSTPSAPTPNGGCNPYIGDTERTATLPILCFIPLGLPAPAGLPNPNNFYSGWSGGQVALSSPVRGSQLRSLAQADAFCANELGHGWRMAEFHDGRGGWGFRAYGYIANTTRFWVHINDQKSNPWQY